MKRFNILVVFLALIFSCKSQEKEQKMADEVQTAVEFSSFGEAIEAEGAMSASAMTEKFQGMAVADTVKTKFTAKVTDVCQAKGCWMKLQLKDGHETMVRFKDYGFFMPKDIAGKEVIVNGLAFVEEMSVDDQKHYAEDEGLSEEEIAKITQPKKTFSFEADGVLLKQ